MAPFKDKEEYVCTMTLSLQNKYEDCVYTIHSVQRLIINGQRIWTLSIDRDLTGNRVTFRACADNSPEGNRKS